MQEGIYQQVARKHLIQGKPEAGGGGKLIFLIGIGPADHDGQIGRPQALQLLQGMLIRGRYIIEYTADAKQFPCRYLFCGSSEVEKILRESK